jgi:hypothetical protein
MLALQGGLVVKSSSILIVVSIKILHDGGARRLRGELNASARRVHLRGRVVRR